MIGLKIGVITLNSSPIKIFGTFNSGNLAAFDIKANCASSTAFIIPDALGQAENRWR